MESQAHVILVTQTKVKKNKHEEFAEWQGKLTKVLEKFPGYVTQKISAPNPPVQEDWIIMQYFTSGDRAKAWLHSQQRQDLVSQASSLTLGFDDIYLIDLDVTAKKEHPVTATIASKIKANKENDFIDWHSRISAVESKFPGFIGSRIEGPRPGVHDTWITILTFDSNENLENWLKSESRKKFITELNAFSDDVTIRKMYAGFDLWFKDTSSQPSTLKVNMLVLLTLYPIVYLYTLYVQPLIMPKAVPFWLAMFVGNAISTIILGWVTVPILVKGFKWWLNSPNKLNSKYNILGFISVFALYGLLLLIFAFLPA